MSIDDYVASLIDALAEAERKLDISVTSADEITEKVAQRYKAHIAKLERERDEWKSKAVFWKHEARVARTDIADTFKPRAETAEAALAECRKERDSLRMEASHILGYVRNLAASRAEVERLREALKTLDSMIFNDPQVIERARAMRDLIQSALSGGDEHG